MTAIANALRASLPHAWQAVTCVENHDIVKVGNDQRIPTLADSSNHRSWYARSRSRVASALLLTAPGIPQIFMGQEVLEDKQWDVNPQPYDMVWWAGVTARARSVHGESSPLHAGSDSRFAGCSPPFAVKM